MMERSLSNIEIVNEANELSKAKRFPRRYRVPNGESRCAIKTRARG